MSFARHLVAPYYAVIFSAQRTAGDHGYTVMAEKMAEMAAQQPGYLGVESARDAEGFGITVSYWQDLESVHAWKQVAEHLGAQALGQSKWYEHYEVRVAKVERAYEGPGGRSAAG
jgi:heme-degrading monooxygenase HmoA